MRQKKYEAVDLRSISSREWQYVEVKIYAYHEIKLFGFLEIIMDKNGPLIKCKLDKIILNNRFTACQKLHFCELKKYNYGYMFY